MAQMNKMYVWRGLSKFRDYSDGMLCVIAASEEEAIELAVDAVIGQDDDGGRALFRNELRVHTPEVIERGVAYTFGGS